ncbi:MAG: hypothetical protein WCO57_08340 [Verrucomicrobiota bacterium]
MNDPQQNWQKLVAAARRANPPPVGVKPVPPGFASRIVAMRESIIVLARVLLWRRWSVSIAILCFVICVVILAIHRCTESTPPLIETPELLSPAP